MKRPLLPFFLMLVAVPCVAQSTLQSFPSDSTGGVPTYLNAEVVRVDRGDARVTLRSESGDVVLTADSRALGILTALRPGTKVLVAYEAVLDETGRTRRIVTYARPASPTSGEPAIIVAPVVATVTTSGSTTRVRTVRGASSAPAIAPAVISSRMTVSAAAPEADTAPVATPTAGTFSNFGGGGLPLIGGAAVPSIPPASPYANTVPSVPAQGAILTAVLPAAVARVPTSEEEVGPMRAYAERDFDAAAVVLAVAANDIDVQWLRFRNVCLEGFVPTTTRSREWFLVLDGELPTPDADECRANLSSLQGVASRWDTQLGIALDAARRNDVLPGRIRETLQRHRIDR